MGEYNGVVGGVSNIVAVNFKPWWEGIEGTVQVFRGSKIADVKRYIELARSCREFREADI